MFNVRHKQGECRKGLTEDLDLDTKLKHLESSESLVKIIASFTKRNNITIIL